MTKKTDAEQLAMIAKGDFYAIDLGNNGDLAIHGKNGPVEVKVTKKGLNPAERFAEKISLLLNGEKRLFDDLPALPVVGEASTPGTSGVDPKLLEKIVASSECDFWKISCRAVKNYRKDTILPDADGRLPQATDAECAEIIYNLAKED